MHIRPETEADRTNVRQVIEAAFKRRAEADLVEVLRRKNLLLVSLVAEVDARAVGHILLSPVSLNGGAQLHAMGLAPMAVAPDYQRKGIGSALVEQGLTRCRELGCGAVVVVGDPKFYRRFGFLPAERYALRCEYDVPADAFMAVELEAGALGGTRGMVRYDDAFAGV